MRIIPKHMRALQITTLEQLPYSLDLAPVHYFFFPCLKALICSQRYYNIPALQEAIKQAIQAIKPEDFRAAIQDLPHQAEMCGLWRWLL